MWQHLEQPTPLHHLLAVLREQGGVSADDKKQAERTIETLCSEAYGYTRDSARDAVALLVRSRYAE